MDAAAESTPSSDPLPGFSSLEEEFNYYARFLEPLVASLSSEKDKVSVARWALALAGLPPSALRNEYLEQLLVCCTLDSLMGVFSSWPPSSGKLRPLPAYHSVSWLERTSLIKDQQEQRKGNANGEQGPPPSEPVPEPQPVLSETSSDGHVFLAMQDIQKRGRHLYFAFSNEPLNKWHGAVSLEEPGGSAPIDSGPGSGSGSIPWLASDECQGLKWLADNPGFVSLPSVERPDSALWQEASDEPEGLHYESSSWSWRTAHGSSAQQYAPEDFEEWYLPVEDATDLGGGFGSAERPDHHQLHLYGDTLRSTAMRGGYRYSSWERSPLASSSGREYVADPQVPVAAIALPYQQANPYPSPYNPRLFTEPAFDSSYEDSWQPAGGVRYQHWNGNSLGESHAHTLSSTDSSYPRWSPESASDWPRQYHHVSMSRSYSEPDFSEANDALIDSSGASEVYRDSSTQSSSYQQRNQRQGRQGQGTPHTRAGGGPRDSSLRQSGRGEFKSGVARRAANTQWQQQQLSRSLSDSSLMDQQLQLEDSFSFIPPRFSSTPQSTATPHRSVGPLFRRRLEFHPQENEPQSVNATAMSSSRASSRYVDAGRQSHAVLLAVPAAQHSDHYYQFGSSPRRPLVPGMLQRRHLFQSSRNSPRHAQAQISTQVLPGGAITTATVRGMAPSPALAVDGPSWTRVRENFVPRATPSWRRTVAPRRLSFVSYGSNASEAEPQVEFPPSNANSSAFTALQSPQTPQAMRQRRNMNTPGQ